MGENIRLTADDGHELSAYRVEANGTPRGGVVVLQEIFGVNGHIREVSEGFARDGFTVIAPALYDRSSQRDCQLGYTPEDVAAGRALREEFSWDNSVRDVGAAVDVLLGEGLKVGTVGYCWGGTISYMAGTRLQVSAAVVYYGGQILPYVNEQARCPMLMHFGKRDQGIPLHDVDVIARAHPIADVHLYDADHGFNCDHRASYDAASAALARERTLAFFRDNLA